MSKERKAETRRFVVELLDSSAVDSFVRAVEILAGAAVVLRESAACLHQAAENLSKRSDAARKANATRRARSAGIGPIIVNAAEFAEKPVNGSSKADPNEGSFAGQP